MKISSEQKSCKKKNKNRKRSKKRKGNKKKLKYQKTQYLRNHMRSHLPVTMSGECYWKNYNNVIQWQRNYLSYINDCNLPAEGSFLLKRATLKTPNKGGDGSESTVITSSDFPSESSGEYLPLSESEDGFEVTEEMMDFLEKSMEHKEAMRLKAEAEAELAPNELEDGIITSVKAIGRDDIEECQSPKEKMVDEKRNQEMNMLYGKASAMILGMETAIQLSFNRNCDVYKPSFWPCLPLKIKFSN